MTSENTVQDLAHANIQGETPFTLENPILALTHIQWKHQPMGSVLDQTNVAKDNLLLLPSYCLGRLAYTAAFMEKFFPQHSIEYAEVLEDFLRNFMIRIMSDPPLESEAQELLLYEEPHAVLMIDGITQYDSISAEIQMDIQHPRVETFPIWKGIGSSWLASKAILETNPQKKLELLLEADDLCPNTTLISENLSGTYYLLEDDEKAIGLLEKALKKRPTARSLFVSSLLGNTDSFEHLKNTYPPLVVELLQREIK